MIVVKIVIVLLLVAMSANTHASILDNKSLEEVQKIYKDNVSKIKDDQLIFIPNSTLTCDSREKYKRGYNYVVNNSNSASNMALRNMGCSSMSGWSIGIVSHTKEGSDIIELVYKVPFADDYITTGFFLRRSLMTLQQRKQMQIK